MKPQQLAALLNISPVTLRHWCAKEVGEFLSPSAQGAKGAKRSFSDQDARILAWVATMKAQNIPLPDIMATLRAARSKNWAGLPELPGGMANDQPIAVVPREAVEERVRALQERYEAQLKTVIAERDQLKTQLQTTQANLVEVQKRITELTEREAELRGLILQYTFGGRRYNAATLIIIALLIGVVLTLLVLLIGMQFGSVR